MDEAGFGTRGNLAGKLYSVTHGPIGHADCWPSIATTTAKVNRASVSVGGPTFSALRVVKISQLTTHYCHLAGAPCACFDR